MRKRNRWGILLICLAAAFAFLDFGVSSSQTRTETSGSIAWCGEGMPAMMQGRPALVLTVTGISSLTPALESEMLAALHGSGQFASIALLPEVRQKAGPPCLLVNVLKKDGLWTPLFATGDVVVQSRFSSSGNIAKLLSDKPFYRWNEDGVVIIFGYEHQVTDTTWGLLTFPAYDRLLARQFAAGITKDILKAYTPK